MSLVNIATLIAAAQSGKVISFPTDTVPALAALPAYAGEIFRLKERSLDKPLILMGAHIAQLWDYVLGSREEKKAWEAIAAQYWPGALTLVLPAPRPLALSLNPLNPQSLGLRIPNHAQARAILAQTGVMATTSANLSGQAPLTAPEAIADAFPEVAVYGGEGWETWSGTPSTVVAWTSQGWEILRQGQIIFDRP
jgi:L-threonylcarbamoyladenylate synthase